MVRHGRLLHRCRGLTRFSGRRLSEHLWRDKDKCGDSSPKAQNDNQKRLGGQIRGFFLPQPASSHPSEQVRWGPRCWPGTPFAPLRMTTLIYFESRKTPAQTKMAANQRRRSTFSLRNSLAAKALPRKVREALAGAASESSTLDRVKSSEKKLSAMDSTPSRNMGLETTARTAPARPARARIRSRSPMRRMAPAVSTSPATAVAATVRMVAQVSKGPA